MKLEGRSGCTQATLNEVLQENYFSVDCARVDCFSKYAIQGYFARGFCTASGILAVVWSARGQCMR